MLVKPAQSQTGFPTTLLGLTDYHWEGEPLGHVMLADALKPGGHTIVFDFKIRHTRVGKGGTGVLTVDGQEFARKKIDHTIPALMAIDETFDVCVDTRTAGQQ